MRLRERSPEVACSTVRKTDRGLRRLSWTQKKSSRKGKIPGKNGDRWFPQRRNQAKKVRGRDRCSPPRIR